MLINLLKLTTSNALIVVSSLDAAFAPSSGQPPSHIPANAAIDLAARKYISKSESKVIAGTHRNSSRIRVCSGSGESNSGDTPGRYSGKRAYISRRTNLKNLRKLNLSKKKRKTE